ncbi:MAG: lytic murein transglycosylase [Candidatus Nomurabacteria bacterium]|nr:MAG: lytic murein transglycosylase [Candidatus Nomurabacteria bacterium]
MKKILAIGVITIMVAMPSLSVLNAETDAERKARLEAELQNVERQILTQQRLVEDKQMERQSLERDMAIIDGQIKKAQLGIQARSVNITQLSLQIDEKEVMLGILEEKQRKQKESLADLVRRSANIEDFTLVEVILSKRTFSDFFEDVASYQSIKESLNESLSILRGIKEDTFAQKNQLESKQETEAEMKRIQELEKQEIEKKEKEKSRILTTTKGQERAYQELLESQQKTAAQLRSQLFDLLGGGGGIPFPEAVELAKYAENKTGVPASLVLAILEQETNLGSHLGSCIYNDLRGGKTVMHPDRDAPIFEAIAKIHGFDPRSRQVSCPITSNGERYGWGGAMGPSQFIPSTWAIYGGIINIGTGWIYDQGSDAIRMINGGTGPANPFSNRDAFLATALLLRDNGANGTASGDRMAALRYYAGWGGASNPANAFYGDQVMNRKARIQGDIAVLGGG